MPGLVHAFPALVGCTSFRGWTDKKTGQTRLEPGQGKCLHDCFHVIDEALGRGVSPGLRSASTTDWLGEAKIPWETSD